MTQFRQIFRQLAQAGRLMVGVGDYNAYCQHMAQHHPELTPMTEIAYFRHCQTARYPNTSGKITRCPC